jgi:methionyl-tRNA formyltransferase
MQVIFMGTPQFAVPVLESLLNGSYQVVAVCTQPDKPTGRRRELIPSPVKALALSRHIPVMQPKTFKSPQAVEELTRFCPDLIVVAAFGLILPPVVLSLPRFGCLNVHPSLLPRHRGPSPVAGAILDGDEITAATIMLLDAGLDSGPILAQREIPILPEDTTGLLTDKLAQLGAALLMDILPGWLEGKIKPQPQDESRATYTRLITSRDGAINWHLPAVEIWRMVRAYNPWPVCYSWWCGKRIKIHSAIPLEGVTQGKVGEVVALPLSPGVGVVTGDGILELDAVQLEGKREMSITEFLRGQRDFIGSVLG